MDYFNKPAQDFKYFSFFWVPMNLETFLLYGPSIIHIYYVGKFIFLTLPLPYVCKHKLSTCCKNSTFELCVALKKCFFGVSMNTYRISANSFRGNDSFLNLTLWTVTFGHSTYRCGNYSRAETICRNTVHITLDFTIKLLDKNLISL